ncbi:15-hydroxyprostaglandin dehydrogenase [NAD(+)]-like isoform X2 [Gigantopelta aegis]|uniref:15-hydroxyprostaglandin dehydrogenase [NAD(+)]-like isoform X2 n=1 Tax=Gigantopelta aegis TaxID=1735272 RepID=UPI001B88C9E0|nr:15-hydroxyprostaglandin dehydrogenase [NAD(+)]-like isoform X2 [Gigantopelta aegis]
MALSGKVAIVTGAAQGLGKAFTERLLQRGARVCVADVKVEDGQRTVSDFGQTYGKDRATFVKCDVSNEKDLEDLFVAVKRRYGPLDIMVNNAGIANETNWSKMVDINMKGLMKGTFLAIEAMRKDTGGHGGVIVNVASSAGLTPVFCTPSYCASKYGVVGFTLSWAESRTIVDLGIRFAVMCPAFTDTEIIKLGTNSIMLQPELATKMMDFVGINKVETVSDAFMQLVDDPESNGTIATITANHGIRFKRHKFTNLSML